jgi:hypothetical protein
VDNVFVGHTFGLGLEIGADAMAEDWDDDFLHIFDGHRKAAVHGGQGLSGMN